MDFDEWNNLSEDDIIRMYDYKRKSKPAYKINFGNATNILAGICIIVFLITALLPENIIKTFLFRGRDWISRPWSLVTNAFFHAGIVHLFFNVFNVWMFGQLLEKKYGSNFIIKLFFGSVILGNLFFGFIRPDVYGLGISGYVYGLIGASVILMPNVLIFSLFGVLPIRIAGPIMFIAEILLSMQSGDGVGHAAHAAGFIAGIIFAYIKKEKGFNIYW